MSESAGTAFRPASGQLSARIHGAAAEMRERAGAARERAATCETTGHVEAAAALRGKAKGYDEAANMLVALDQGRRIPKRIRWTGWVAPVRSNRRSVALRDAEVLQGAQIGAHETGVDGEGDA